MKVYVILEEDRGCGVTVKGVYLKEQDAINYINGNSHYWYKEEEVQGFDDEMACRYSSDSELSQIGEEDKAIRDRIVALISKYTQDMEYCGGYGVSEDDYEDIANYIMIEFKLGEVKMNDADMSDTGRVEQREIEMSNETCPHCGAAGKMNQAHSQVDYDCGSYQYLRSPVSDPDVDDEFTGKLFRLYACYERQLAQKNAEIEKLKQAVIDEREACAKLCDDDLKIKLATAIRARGKVK